MSYFDRFKPLSVDSIVDTGDQKSDNERSLAYEHAREELEKRIVDLVGEKYLTLAKVLSYFPRKAELFIRTQRHAQNITGEKTFIHYEVLHKKDGRGLSGNRILRGEKEYLFLAGYTAQELLELIKEIDKLRGNGKYSEESDYRPDESMLKKILDIRALQPVTENRETELMYRKTLEVMGVKDKEILLIVNYLDKLRRADQIKNEAQHIIAEARALIEQAMTIRQEARDEVESVYPRHPRE